MEEAAEDKTGLRVVQASEVLVQIEKGKPIEYDGKIIIGDLDLTHITLPITDGKPFVSSRISITNSRIEGSIVFNKVYFKDKVQFLGTEFSGPWIRFDEAQFSKSADFKNVQFDHNAYFTQAQFGGNADFSDASFKGDALIAYAQFNGYAIFIKTYFEAPASFSAAYFNESAIFLYSRFGGDTSFIKAHFDGPAIFTYAKFDDPSYFDDAVFHVVLFHSTEFNNSAHFIRTRFGRDSKFSEVRFKGDALIFRDSKFDGPRFQEEACRKAKNVLEKSGNREEAGYHFYREMEAKRMQKPWYYRYPEFALVQVVFGYGVHPWWLMYWWVFIVTIFALLYAYGNGISGAVETLDYIKISFAIAIAPGYIAAIINPGSAGYRLIDEYQIVAMAETIVGTFLWAGFIATFARKYMR